MPSILFSLPELFSSYKSWVSANPLAASDVESSVKWLSYFIAGRVNNSHILTELVYCLSNILVFFNDSVISKARNLSPRSHNTLKTWLTVLEYSEVLVEISGRKRWGEKGRWLIVAIVQTLKCLMRLLLLQSDRQIIETPAIQLLQRKNLRGPVAQETDLMDPSLSDISFTLKRSGRVIRKITATPPNSLRTWMPLNAPSVSTRNCEVVGGECLVPLSKASFAAEVIYVVKPIVHLAAMGCFGTKTWRSYIVAFVLDLVSMQLHNTSQRHLAPQQRKELSRRQIALLLYLIRSPMFDLYTRDKFMSVLKCISTRVPLAGFIANPLQHYLPFWQDTYSYVWSS